MPTEFKLPDLGENIDSGDVVSVLVAVGDALIEDQPVIELETDKAVIEVPSSVSGVVRQIHVKEGDKAAVGQLLLTVDAGDGDSHPEEQAAPQPAPKPEEEPPERTEGERSPASAEPPAASPSGPAEFKLPDLGENIDSGDVVSVLVAVGDALTEDQPVIELETDKAVIEVPSSVSGVVRQIHVEEGDKAAVGQLLLTVDAGGPTLVEEEVTPEPSPAEEPVTQPPPEEEPAPRPPDPAYPAPVSGSGKLVPAAPSVRRLAREIGVDIAQVVGTGPQGRISENDVKTHSRQLHARKPAAAAAPPAALALPDFSQWGEVERQPMTNVRRVTAERMHQAWSTIPQVTQFDQADVTDVEGWRRAHGQRVEAAGAKLTPTAIVLKVAAAALKVFPQFNASIDMANQEIIYRRYCHIGVAVDTDRGLLVPVLRDVDRKNLIEISAELGQIAEKARARRIAPEDMQGGCFTVSNLGGIGGTGFTPIVNPPEVAILGVARSRHEPVFVDGEFKPRLMMPLSLSYDHRLIDGAAGARFLRWVAQALENPFLLILEG